MKAASHQYSEYSTTTTTTLRVGEDKAATIAITTTELRIRALESETRTGTDSNSKSITNSFEKKQARTGVDTSTAAGLLEVPRPEHESIVLDRDTFLSQKLSAEQEGDTSQFFQSGLRLHTNRTNFSNNNVSGLLEMGYTVAASSNPWIAHESAGKMDNDAEEQSTTRDSERKERAGDGEASVSSSPRGLPAQESANTAQNADDDDRAASESRQRHPMPAFGTPSTVSTVASSDDVSLDFIIDPPTFERLSWKIDDVPGTGSATTHRTAPPIQRLAMNSHRRSTSWEDAHGIHPIPTQNQWTQRFPIPSSVTSPQGDVWNASGHARVASFRTDQQTIDSNGHYNYLQMPQTDVWRQQQQRRAAEYHQYYLGHQASHLPPSGQYHQQARKQSAPGSPTSSPRNRLNVRPLPTRQPGTLHPPGGGGGPIGSTPRSSSEVLKTLLRKKACLYEPDTSKAVALVSWLVGRELALEYGYFSRQQLQSGVHACVAAKIDAGAITRTKVNRCMQIILNSCFHYIIPRSDGSEENGDSFRQQFAESARDDRALLTALLPPWTNVSVDKHVVLHASTTEDGGGGAKKSGAWSSPQHSPRLSSSETPTAAAAAAHDVEGDDHHSKRSVLLCFNENVRSAEEAFRCHNEFIRDAANASKLQLTASEWRSFFGEDSGKPSITSGYDSQKRETTGNGLDVLGEMTDKELATFRTTWCAKRYDHDHYLCGFAHAEVDGGWLRRNPQIHTYRAEMCPDVVTVQDALTGAGRVTIHLCPKGENCPLAHSKEEMVYHPSNYKKNPCPLVGSPQGCALGDVCPNLHHQSAKHTVRVAGLDHHHHHGSQQQQRYSAISGRQQTAHDPVARAGRPATKIPPSGVSTLYVIPAPFSAFERQLHMPGLQSLFRRRSSVLCSCLDSPAKACAYSNFGREGDSRGVIAKPRPTVRKSDY